MAEILTDDDITLSMYDRLASSERIEGGRTSFSPLPLLEPLSDEVLRDWASLRTPAFPLSRTPGGQGATNDNPATRSPVRPRHPVHNGGNPGDGRTVSPSRRSPAFSVSGAFWSKSGSPSFANGIGGLGWSRGEKQQQEGWRHRASGAGYRSGDADEGGVKGLPEDGELVGRYLRSWKQVYHERRWEPSSPLRSAFGPASALSPTPVERDAQIDGSIERLRSLQTDLRASASSTSALLSELERLEPQHLPLKALQQQHERLAQRASSVRRVLHVAYDHTYDPFTRRLPLSDNEDGKPEGEQESKRARRMRGAGDMASAGPLYEDSRTSPVRPSSAVGASPRPFAAQLLRQQLEVGDRHVSYRVAAKAIARWQAWREQHAKKRRSAERVHRYSQLMAAGRALRRLRTRARSRMAQRSRMQRATHAQPSLVSLRGFLRLCGHVHERRYFQSIEPWARRMRTRALLTTGLAQLHWVMRQRAEGNLRMCTAINHQHVRRLDDALALVVRRAVVRRGHREAGRRGEEGRRRWALPTALTRWLEVVRQRRLCREADMFHIMWSCTRALRRAGLRVQRARRGQEKARRVRAWVLRRRLSRGLCVWRVRSRLRRWKRMGKGRVDALRTRAQVARALRIWARRFMQRRREALAILAEADAVRADLKARQALGRWRGGVVDGALHKASERSMAQARRAVALRTGLRTWQRHLGRQAEERGLAQAVDALRASQGLRRWRRRLREAAREWRFQDGCMRAAEERARGGRALQALRRWAYRVARLKAQRRSKRRAKELRYDVKLGKGMRAWRRAMGEGRERRQREAMADEGFAQLRGSRALSTWARRAHRRKERRALLWRAHWHLLHSIRRRGVKAWGGLVRRQTGHKLAITRAVSFRRRLVDRWILRRWFRRFRARRDYRLKARKAGRMLVHSTLYRCFMAVKHYHAHRTRKHRARLAADHAWRSKSLSAALGFWVNLTHSRLWLKAIQSQGRLRRARSINAQQWAAWGDYVAQCKTVRRVIHWRMALLKGKAVKTWLRVTREKAMLRSKSRMFREMVRGLNVRTIFTAWVSYISGRRGKHAARDLVGWRFHQHSCPLPASGKGGMPVSLQQPFFPSQPRSALAVVASASHRRHLQNDTGDTMGLLKEMRQRADEAAARVRAYKCAAALDRWRAALGTRAAHREEVELGEHQWAAKQLHLALWRLRHEGRRKAERTELLALADEASRRHTVRKALARLKTLLLVKRRRTKLHALATGFRAGCVLQRAMLCLRTHVQQRHAHANRLATAEGLRARHTCHRAVEAFKAHGVLRRARRAANRSASAHWVARRQWLVLRFLRSEAQLRVRFYSLKLASRIFQSLSLKRSIYLAWTSYVHARKLTRASQQRWERRQMLDALATLRSRVEGRRQARRRLVHVQQWHKRQACRRVLSRMRQWRRSSKAQKAAALAVTRLGARRVLVQWKRAAQGKAAAEVGRAWLGRAIRRWKAQAGRGKRARGRLVKAEKLRLRLAWGRLGRGMEGRREKTRRGVEGWHTARLCRMAWGLRRWQRRVRRRRSRSKTGRKHKGLQQTYTERLLRKRLMQWSLRARGWAGGRMWALVAKQVWRRKALRAAWRLLERHVARRQRAGQLGRRALEGRRDAALQGACGRWVQVALWRRRVRLVTKMAEVHRGQVLKLGALRRWAARARGARRWQKGKQDLRAVVARRKALRRWRSWMRSRAAQEQEAGERDRWMSRRAGWRALVRWHMWVREHRATAQGGEIAGMWYRLMLRRGALLRWAEALRLQRACSVAEDVGSQYFLQVKGKGALDQWVENLRVRKARRRRRWARLQSALVAWVSIRRGARRQQDALTLADRARRDKALSEGWRVLQAHVLHSVQHRAAKARALRAWRRGVLETVWAALVQGSQAGTRHLAAGTDHRVRTQAMKALSIWRAWVDQRREEANMRELAVGLALLKTMRTHWTRWRRMFSGKQREEGWVINALLHRARRLLKRWRAKTRQSALDTRKDDVALDLWAVVRQGRGLHALRAKVREGHRLWWLGQIGCRHYAHRLLRKSMWRLWGDTGRRKAVSRWREQRGKAITMGRHA